MDSRDDLPETPFDVFGALDPVPEQDFCRHRIYERVGQSNERIN